MTVIVRWNNSLSDVLRVRSGARQAGVLSPYLFNVYANETISLIILLLVVLAVILSKFYVSK